MWYHPMLWTAAFVLSLGIDLVYTRYVLFVVKKERLAAAICSAILPLLGAAAVFVFLDDVTSLVASSIGHGLGAWVAIGNSRYRVLDEMTSDS